MNEIQITEDTLIDIEESINMKQGKYSLLAQSKKELEVDQLKIKNTIRAAGRNGLDNLEYKTLTRKQGESADKIRLIEVELSEIKDEIRKRNILRDRVRLELGGHIVKIDKPLNTKLIELRDKYMTFASDLTRVSSMRTMASQMAQDLEKIIQADADEN